MIGQRLGHYRIEEKIGAGGMGVVYRAHDERLDRDVALKVLPTGTLADEGARKRFRKEALALGRLNHPNIGAIYDFDTQDAQGFLVMEYVTGGTLANRLTGMALSEKEVAVFGAQIAAALEEAHEHGIVHRDLKPANIAVTLKGQAKVLDFGLAKLLQPGSAGIPGESLTASVAEAEVAGTLPYMAPEQVEGERVDARTDIHALGAVLYEMATGRRPFHADSVLRLSDAIRRQPPVSPRALQPRVSLELERIILKCLEKDPDNRYQSAKELGVDLRRMGTPPSSSGSGVAAELPKVRARTSSLWWMGAGLAAVALLAAGIVLRPRLFPASKPPTGKIMLAVLPFGNLSGDPTQDYFSDGLTEEMIAQLGRLQPDRLGVIARTSAMQYKDTKKTADQIAQELNVGYLLEGSVRRAGDQVRITAQLVQMSDQTHMWAENYDRKLEDVLKVQSEVAQRIADTLALELLPATKSRLTASPSVNPTAHEAYLEGRFFLNKKFTEQDIRRAIDYFQKALRIDPQYAPAFAGLADCWNALADFYLAPSETGPNAKEAALKALSLDDTLAEAHASLGFVKCIYDWDWSGAEKEFQRALQLDPAYAQGYNYYALLLGYVGRFEEAERASRRAAELDPLSRSIPYVAGGNDWFARKNDLAVRQFQWALELDPHNANVRAGLAIAYEEMGKTKEALAEAERCKETDSLLVLATIGGVYARLGKNAEAHAILSRLREAMKSKFVCPYEVALIHLGLGQKDEAFQYLEKAFSARSVCMPLLKYDPRWESVRTDPRYLDLLRRMNFPE